MREGLLWSNGRPLTAHDFVFAWLKQMSAEAANGYSFIMTDYIVNGAEYHEGRASAEEVGVKAIDDRTLEVTLKAQSVRTECRAHDLLRTLCDCLLRPGRGGGSEKDETYWDVEHVRIQNAQICVIKDASEAWQTYLEGGLSQVHLDASHAAVWWQGACTGTEIRPSAG